MRWLCTLWREHPPVTDELSLEQYLALLHVFARPRAG